MINPARRVRPLAAALLAISLSTAAAAQAPAANLIGIDNFAKVNDDYFRGAQPAGEDYASLASLGVKTVINLIGDSDLDASEQSMVEEQGMRYVHIPMSTRKAPTADEIATFMNAVNAEGAVYVHCVGGRHRTGVMTAIYRMTTDGLSGEQAFKEMKQFKYGPDFLHPEFKKFVSQYEPKKATTAVATTSSQQ